MNEVRALVQAFDLATATGESCALATLVHVEGSSYRAPGARMLICGSGSTTGTISAGCLEADVVEHALAVLEAGKPKLVTYDTGSTSEDQAWGLGLGCNGVVHVLIEPLAPGSLYLQALRRSCESNAASVAVATVYATGDEPALQPGARLLFEAGGDIQREGFGGDAASRVEAELRATLLQSNMSLHVAGLSIFVERLLPPVPLVIFGAGNDVLPVVQLASALGWHTEVVDPQARRSSLQRFAAADQVTLARPEEVPDKVHLTQRTMVLLMGHNYSQDLASLHFALASPAQYIGMVGARQRAQRMLGEVIQRGTLPLDAASLARVHAPVGLDIGANGPFEIALSIVAEMRAVLQGRRGGMLRQEYSLRVVPVSAAG